jgi:trimeric autotransporter adhesin
MNSHRHKHTRSILSALLCAALWLNALPAWAAEVHGQVKFGGLPLPGATVSASQGDKNFVAVADQNGNYSIPDLADGVWSFKVEMLGFTPITQDVTAATNPPIPAPPADFDLKMLSLDEIKAIAGPAATQAPTISYTAPAAEAPTNTAIPTAPAGKKQAAAAGKKGAPAAPATGQNSFQRTDLKANAAPPATNAVPNPEANATNSFNAQDTAELSQRANDGFLVNGSQNNGASTPFAQAGRFGNNVRGPNSLYQFMAGFIIDNSALDARTYSITGLDTAKPQTNRFTVLGSFAGPLRIKHWFKQPPTIFLNYQFTRNTNGTTTPALMPTADQIAGNFAGSALIYDPSTGLPFANNAVPSSQISPEAQALLKLYKQPNFNSGISYNYQVPIVSLTQSNNVQARFNKSLTTKDQLSGQFGYQYNSNNNPNIFDFIDTGNGQGINIQLNEQHRFTPRTFGNLTVQFSRQSNQLNPFFANQVNVSGKAGITGNNQEPVNWGPPNLSFSNGISGLSDGNSSLTRNQTTAIAYSTTWIHGRHSVQYGGDFRWQQFNSLSQANPRGSFTFTGQQTQQMVSGVAVPGTGNGFADFLLGRPDTSGISFGNADKYFRTKMVDAFVNDDWRIGPSLTLNLGVRWDYGAPITEKYDRLANLDVMPGFTAIAPVTATNPTGSLTGEKYPDSLVRPDRKEFQPIVGFAWRPFPASSVVVRGGYSLRYNTSVYNQIATQMAQQSPFSTSLQVANTFTTPPLNTLASGFNTLLGTTTNNFAIDPNFRVGYAQNWYTTIQKDLPASLIMIVGYYGTKGTRGPQEFYPNTYPVLCETCPPHGYIYETSNGNSTREAGNLQLRRRLHNGFTANLQYTYAKAIDDSALGGRGAANLVAQNWLDLSAERALSTTDQRHLLNFTMQYTTGQGIGGGTLLNGWRGALFKEWTVVSSVNVGSGLPLTPIYGVAVPGTGFFGFRPNYTGADIYSNAPGQFLNPLAYAAPSGTWGNAGRDTITGPSQFSMNASFARTFRLRDRYSLDVRIDSVNPINHVTYTSWNTTITPPESPQYGTAVAANAMRSLQTTLRLRF